MAYHKIKIIKASSSKEVEDHVNEFLLNNEAESIQYQIELDDYQVFYSVLIYYKTS